MPLSTIFRSNATPNRAHKLRIPKHLRALPTQTSTLLRQPPPNKPLHNPLNLALRQRPLPKAHQRPLNLAHLHDTLIERIKRAKRLRQLVRAAHARQVRRQATQIRGQRHGGAATAREEGGHGGGPAVQAQARQRGRDVVGAQRVARRAVQHREGLAQRVQRCGWERGERVGCCCGGGRARGGRLAACVRGGCRCVRRSRAAVRGGGQRRGERGRA